MKFTTCSRYEKNKRLCAAEFRSDREAYTAAKADFIREVLRRLWLVRN
ncbi:GrpB family protein [Marinobacter iranensis]